MIWDCFLFNDELELLECRLEELAEVVDRFVIVEGDMTHTGVPKPYQFQKHRHRFDHWREQIVYIRASLPVDPDPWVRENAQRNYVSLGIQAAADGDVVMVSDVDEIPRAATVADLELDGTIVALEQRYYSFAVDWEMPVRWYGTTVAFARQVRGYAQQMRDARNGLPRIPNGGWHLSWLGGPERTLPKLATSPHLEMVQETREGIESGKYLRDGGTMSVFGDVPMIPVDVDETWPRYVFERRCPESWFRPR